MGKRLDDGSWQDACLDKVKPGEPIFILRAHDLTASECVRFWADNVRRQYMNAGIEITQALKDKLDEANRTADEMIAWSAGNGSKLPD